MNNNSRWRNYGLWVSIAAVIPLLLSAFGIKVVPSEYQEIVNAVLAILVTAGIISNPTTTTRWFTDDPNQPSDKTTHKTDDK